MKRRLLFLLLSIFSYSSYLHAQTFKNGDASFVQDVGTNGTSCLKYISETGYLSIGSNIESTTYSDSENAIEISHTATIDLEKAPGWWEFYYTNGEFCDNMRTVGGVNLSSASNQTICITAKASVAGKYYLFLGKTAADSWFPSNNTYSDNIALELDLTTSYQKISVNLNGTGFENLSYKNSINTWSISPSDNSQGGSKVYVKRIGLGADGCNEPDINIQIAGTNYASNSTYTAPSTVTGSYTDLNFTIQNKGTATLTINQNNIAVYATGFSLLSNNTISIAPGSSATVPIRFSPTKKGEHSGLINIVSNDPDTEVYTINVKGTGLSPEINVINYSNSSSFDYGKVSVGASIDKTFSIENTGDAVLTISSISTSNSAFAINGTVPTSINAGASATITVSFSPDHAGDYSTNLVIVNNDLDESTYSINLVGEGVSPEINVKQGSANYIQGSNYNFGNINNGTNSDVVFTIQNTGTAALTILDLEVAGSGYSLLGSAPTSIASGATGNFTVRFSPLTATAYLGTITITSNDNDEETYVINLLGAGQGVTVNAPEINVQESATNYLTGSNYNFGSINNGTNKDVVFTIQNTGTATLTISELNISGSGYSLLGSAPTSVASGATGNFTVRFSPLTATAYVGTITITNNDSDEGSYVINLSGAGQVVTVNTPEINVQESATNYLTGSNYNFGSTNNGTNKDVVFTIQNTGTATLTISELNISGSGFSLLGSAPTSIASGATGNFTVRFSPLTASTYGGTITITNNDNDEGSYVINLTGTGQGATVNASEINVQESAITFPSGSTYNFGSILVGSNDEAVFIVQNTGNIALTISSINVTGTGFTVVGSTPTSVAVGGSESFTVRFAPEAAGNATGSIAIINNDTDEGTYTISLTGIGTPTSIFGKSNSNDLSVYIDNNGSINVKGVKEGKYNFVLSNIAGVELYKGQVQVVENQTVINTNNLTKGIYLLSFINEKGQVESVKLMY